MRLKNVGTTEYSSWDAGLRRGVQAAPGAVCEVSEEKGAQMLRDYPGRFEVVTEQPAPVAGETERTAGEPRPAPVIRRRGRARA